MIGLATAQGLIETACEAARREGHAVAVTVLDGRGVVVGVARMDTAIPASVPTSLAKARTAWLFGCPTEELAGLAPSLGPAVSEPVCVFAGGLPLRRSERVIGAVGVSGAAEECDARVAAAVSGALAASAAAAGGAAAG